jgi:hypothetical protein
MTKRKRRILWKHTKGIAQVLLQLIGLAATWWVLFCREPAPKILFPNTQLQVVAGHVVEITIEGKP